MINCESQAALSNEERKQAENLFQQYRDRIFSYLRARVPDHHTAEDLLSEVFFKVLRSLNTFQEAKASYSTWIYTITQNTVIDYYRTNRSNRQLPLEEVAQQADVTTLSPEEVLQKEEMLEWLAEVLESLPDREQEILVLRFYFDLTPKEIAERMGLSYINVKVLQSRAIARLRKKK